MTKNTEERIPEETIDPKSKIAREADAFLSAIASGADEDEADEAAFLTVNPNGVVVDEDGDVLKKGAKSAIEVGEKVEFNALLVSDENGIKVGKDCAFKVVGEVLKQDKMKKVVVFKYKAKKQERKKQGHRQPFTAVKIESITAK